jgi:hypothetical protein
VNIELPSYRYARSEGALSLPKSKGDVKERIHLFKYEGDPILLQMISLWLHESFEDVLQNLDNLVEIVQCELVLKS